MNNMPGYCTTEVLWSVNRKNLKKVVEKHIIPFLKEGGIKEGDLLHDIGEYNPRIDYIAKAMGLTVATINEDDFNWWTLDERGCQTVIAFEIFEHIANPLLFMNELKRIIKYDGSIYLIIPNNPYFLWQEGHFFEMSRKHFEKWIIKPLGLEIVRYKKYYFITSWKIYLIGFRPLKRLLTGKTTLKEFIRSLFYFQYGIYEVKKCHK